MNIIDKKVDELIPYVNNPRENDDAVDAVASSIKNFGFKVPIVIDSKNEIVNGHTRLKAAKKLGIENIPAIIADDLTPEQIKAFRLADNRVGELSVWDSDALAIELEELSNSDFDMSMYGFDSIESDVDIDDIFFDDEEQAEKDSAIYLTFGSKKAPINEETLNFLEKQYNDYENAETNEALDFVQWLLKDKGVDAYEVNVS